MEIFHVATATVRVTTSSAELECPRPLRLKYLRAEAPKEPMAAVGLSHLDEFWAGSGNRVVWEHFVDLV